MLQSTKSLLCSARCGRLATAASTIFSSPSLSSSPPLSSSPSGGGGGIFAPTKTLLAASSRRRKHLKKLVFDEWTNPLSKTTTVDKGVLYVVPVPIGNLKDFSLRALEILRQVDYIICINRVATDVLMDIIDINTSGRLVQYNKHLKSQRRLAELVSGGASAALVSTQGTPVVGDQGGDVVAQFLASGVRVSALPGPCAAVSALAMAGTAGAEDAFFFGGHLSLQQATRMRQLREVVHARQPCVFYEAKPRLQTTLQELAAVSPGRRVSVVHEISKVHEATHRDTVERLAEFYGRGSQRSSISKGAVTIVVDADPEKQRMGHELMSAAVRNEQLRKFDPKLLMSSVNNNQQQQKDNNEGDDDDDAANVLNNKHDTDTAASSLSYREKVLASLVRDQSNRASTSADPRSAIILVADAMNVSRADVASAVRKAEACSDEELFSPVFASSPRSLTQQQQEQQERRLHHEKPVYHHAATTNNDGGGDRNVSTRTKLAAVAKQLQGNNNNNPLKQFTKYAFTQHPASATSTHGSAHFPDDWVAEEDDEMKSSSSTLQQNVGDDDGIVQPSADSSSPVVAQKSTTKKTDSKKVVRQKLIRAIAKQNLKNKIARAKLTQERMSPSG